MVLEVLFHHEEHEGYEAIFHHSIIAIGGRSPISAKLFCKRSQVTFMPYGIVLKDERRTY
jgi:hypothetical protein